MAETLSRLRYCLDPFSYNRRKTRAVMVGKVGVGGGNPIRVQSMTTTDTMDVQATLKQCLRLVEAKCEIIRITTPTAEDARRLGKVKEELLKRGLDVPLVADIHFSPQAAMEAADYADKVRINPGNFVDTKRFAVKEYTDSEYDAEIARIEERFTPLVEKLKRLKRALRIGTNHGSLSDRIMNRYGDSPLGMVESALEFVRICEKNDYHDIILSMKASNPKVMIQAYRLLAARMDELGMDYPFHLGVTEAGDGEDGRIKSSIGIGSLMADGIGDTIRVSLTEEPEAEVPVCYALAAPFSERGARDEGAGVRNGKIATGVLSGSSKPSPLPPHLAPLSYCPDFFSYSRRPSSVFRVGPFTLGGSQPVRVATTIPSDASAAQILAWLEEKLKAAKGDDPEILEWTVETAEDLKKLKSLREGLKAETSRLALLVRLNAPLPIALESLSYADAALWSETAPPVEFLKAVKKASLPLFIEASTAADALAQDAAAREAGLLTVLSLRGEDTTELLHEYRKLAASAGKVPLLIRAPKRLNEESQVLEASLLIGALLSDGLGDAAFVESEGGYRRSLELAYNILQGAQTRITKAEFVSCPSCGRTLFDLQSTTERIKKKTGHLKGVKIAIMGCIVNGPGEMADADFGYVGGAPGKINLYVGKECVQKGIPMDTADEALVQLIKTHNKWVEPK